MGYRKKIGIIHVPEDWYEVVKIFLQMLGMGRNWKTFKDMPHFKKKGFTIGVNSKRIKLESQGYIII